MGQVAVTLNGRTYRLECNEGEEAHLAELAEYVGAHVDEMRRKFGQVGDDRLILMASLFVTDELWALRADVENLRAQLAEARRDKSESDENARSIESQLFARIGDAAARLEGLNTRLTEIPGSGR
ncbi:MAG: cell division protein ZapA [Methyloceanibacter sp.]|nr:cell division protein ZapA [Methyloceanibacter sp.]